MTLIEELGESGDEFSLNETGERSASPPLFDSPMNTHKINQV